MPKRFVLVAVLTSLLIGISQTVHAQQAVRIGSLGISVYPEYDQPGVLVQYEGAILGAADKSNPREVAFFVPQGAGVGAACAVQANGNHTSETWKESDASGGFTRVTYTISEPNFHLEYYYNPLTGVPDKKMDYVYQAALPADEIHIEIQHPLKATNFVLTPDTKDSHQDDDGFTYHTYTFKQVAAGQQVSASVAYTKTDPKPSISNAPKSAPASNSSNDSGVNPKLVVLLSVVVLGIGVVGYFVWERRGGRPRYAPARATRSSNTSPVTLQSGFCTECGSGLDAEDKFCGKCGTPRR
jgi:zinc ribbon protein